MFAYSLGISADNYVIVHQGPSFNNPGSLYYYYFSDGRWKLNLVTVSWHQDNLERDKICEWKLNVVTINKNISDTKYILNLRYYHIISCDIVTLKLYDILYKMSL